MNRRYYKQIILSCILFFVTGSLHAVDFIITEDGIILRPDSVYSGSIKEVHINVISPAIIRVTAVPYGAQLKQESLMITNRSFPGVTWNVRELNGQVWLVTSKLSVVASLENASILFLDEHDRILLSEKPFSRKLTPQVFEGQPLFNVQQTFETLPDDAWYGLGQHEDGLMNYKTYQVQLFQNNTEVAVPFLISKKNYGILWDNYSLTYVGDTRPYRSLSALKLYSKNDEAGWLTASYSNDRDNADGVTVQRAESDISFEFLNDSRLYLPKEFRPENGIATWEGSFSSSITGIHKLRFTYAGYVKVWINNKLMLDRWRQSWNPGSVILDIEMQKDEKNSIKIEWIPYGGESYLSLKYLPPLSEEETNSFSFSSEAGEQLDYYFIHGNNMDSVISGYRKLTGRAVMLPRWAFGKWQSRERYKTQKELLDVAAEFRQRRIPLDNIVQDWSYWKEAAWGSQEFDETRFPGPDSMIGVLHDKHKMHFMISVWPKFYEAIPAYNEFKNKGWLYMRNIADRQKDWIAQGYVSTFYDAFNEDAQKGFWDLLRKNLYSKGVDAWWMDASEPDILSNVSPQKRKEQMSPTALGPAAQFLNAYPLQNAKGIYEGQRQTNPDERVFILTRSAYGGLQRYASVTWSGDIASRWHDMKAQLSAGVNFSMSGLPYWTMDIGGFAVESRFEKPDAEALEEWRELQTRWYQFGAYVPLFRVHGQFPIREIYNIAPADHEAYKSMLYYNRLRYRFLPYIYSLAGHAFHQNGTLMRGLVMDFPNDKNVTGINDAYMFGPSLLVNPVFEYRQRSRTVYLPGGTGWYNLYTGKYVEGGDTIIAQAEYERMPVFVKAGSILPTGPELQYTDEKPADEITLHVYTGADGSFSLYEDEGTNYNYEKGAFSIIPVQYHESTSTLTIGNRQGSFKGMLKKRKFHIVWIGKNKPYGMDSKTKVDATINYTGKAITVKKS